jgi:hypothetical protein
MARPRRLAFVDRVLVGRGVIVMRQRLLLAAVVYLCVVVPAAAAPRVTAAAPPNDSFANASVLQGPSATVTVANDEATKEAGEPNHAGDAGGHSLWWRFTAPATGGVSIDTCGTDTSIVVDTLLAVYTGDNVGALTEVKSNDDSLHDDLCSTIGSSLTFVATQGQTYSIAVDGKDGDTGEIKLVVQPTLTLNVATLTRPRRIDATKFVIDVAGFGDGVQSIPEDPTLTLVRGTGKTRAELETVGDSETRFQTVFDWSCDRHGDWRWTVSVRRDGVVVSQTGSFTVPACVRKNWYVSRSKVVDDFAADVGRADARWLRCSAVGNRQGSLAHTWRCRMAIPGWSCSGSFLFHYVRLFQLTDVVESGRIASGRVQCRR